MIDRVAAWIQSAGCSVYTLHCRNEEVYSHEVRGELTADASEDIAADLDSAAQDHADSSGRGGVHVFVIRGERDGLNEECRLRIRKKPENDAQLGKMVTELHKTLMKGQKSTIDGIQKILASVQKENARYRSQQVEFFTKLENMRSKELERTIMLEEHESKKALHERITNAGIPALLAVANAIVGKNMLPAPDMRATSITEIARSFKEEQVDALADIIEEPNFGEKLAQAVDGQTDVDYFMRLFRSLNMQQAQALFGVLNPGQQMNLQALLQMGVQS